MNSEKLKLWINDLRTTDAPQGTGYLNGPKGYCCLGRLCEVAIEDGLAVEKTGDLGGLTIYGSYESVPPLSVLRWLDLDDDADDLIGACVEWNDCDGKTFTEIADALERAYIITRKQA